MEVMADATVVITLQYINISNQHIVYLRLTQCYIPIVFHFFKKMCDFFMVERQSCLQGNYIKFLGSWS